MGEVSQDADKRGTGDLDCQEEQIAPADTVLAEERQPGPLGLLPFSFALDPNMLCMVFTDPDTAIMPLENVTHGDVLEGMYTLGYRFLRVLASLHRARWG